jgi:hypothetical protein
MRTLLISSFLCGIASAQVGGPLIGYLPDGSRIRPMNGLPAAGAIGAAIDTARDFSRIAISPRQNFALASAADTGEVMVVKPGINLTTITGAAKNPDILAISPHGSSAALWFSSTGKLQIVSGLPDAPAVRTVDASFLSDSPLALAISDDAQWSAGLWSAGVYAFGPSGTVIPVQTDPGVVALAFFHNRHDLALATATRATKIADIGGSTQPTVLYDYSAQPLSPRAIAISFDNQQAVVADASGKLLNIGIASTATVVDCGCSPEGLFGLGGAVFRLTGHGASGRNESHTELKLFDAATGAVLIVPPALSETGGRQ